MNGMEKQLPFATSKALNECATLFQHDERALMRNQFTIRRPWVLQGVKINREDFATKQKLSVRVHIDGGRDFFNKFEEGGTKSPRSGKSITVPIHARASPKSVIRNDLRPKALAFKGSGNVKEGQKGTFLIQKPDGTGVILQRLTRKLALKKRQHGPQMKGKQRDHTLKVLYILKPRVPIPPSLKFLETAQKSFAKHWAPTFTKWWDQAVKTAKP